MQTHDNLFEPGQVMSRADSVPAYTWNKGFPLKSVVITEVVHISSPFAEGKWDVPGYHEYMKPSTGYLIIGIGFYLSV